MDLREIASVLKAVTDTPLLEARLLKENCPDLENAIKRRLAHEPISKIIGKKGFWKSEFITSTDVLDPRPDSETMIEAVLKHCPPKKYRILDIGTGSGCLLFSLLDEYPDATGIGIDKSPKALAVATKNQQNRSAELIEKDFFMADWYRDLGTFDIVISNPPYIPSEDILILEPDVREYDPMMALDGGEDGLNAYRAISKNILNLLNDNGFLFLEIGIHQAKSVIDIFTKQGLTHIKTHKDLSGIERILTFQKKTCKAS